MTRSLIAGNQMVDADVLSEAEHDAWIHKNLVCSGTVTIEDAAVMISGTGDIHCTDLYVDDTKLSSDGSGGLLINDSPITSTAITTGYTGTIPIITNITVSGIAYKSYLIFEDGLLTTVSGNEQIEFSDGDSLSIF